MSSARRPEPRTIVVEALCLVVVATSGVRLSGQSRRALAELGRFDPPVYAAPLIRKGDAWPVFESAMQAYVRKHYVDSADLLRRAVTAEPEDPAANFFLAASLMMTDEVGEAEDRIGVVLAGGQTPYERAARLLLAKASIRQGNLEAAERELVSLATGADHYALEAIGLLPRVRALRPRK